MTSLLVESTVRSLGFAAAVGLALQILRVRDTGTRLAAWTAVLYGALLLPAMVAVLPPLEVPMLHRAASQKVVVAPAVSVSNDRTEIPEGVPDKRFNWRRAAVDLYFAVALGLLGRLVFGLIATRRLRRASRPVNDARLLAMCSVRLVESSALAVPITIGWLHPVVVLPDSWREWDDAKIAAVLAHELSHVRRGDYATLLLASLYRCAFWFSPLAWWLDQQLRELAEQASDDSALRATADRTQYAEVLLGFCQVLQNRRGRIRWQGVAMARSARAERRIERILAEDRPLSRPARWPVMAGLAALAIPLLYVCGAFQPVVMAQQAPVTLAAHESKSEKSLDSYIVASGDNTTMSGSSSDLGRAMRIRAKIGDDFIWFRREGKGYVIRDAGILKAAHALFEPQEELGRRQGELGEQQSKLGELQSALGEKQSSVRTSPADVTRLIRKLEQELKTAGTSEELGNVQALLGKLQAEIAERQADVGDRQSKLGEEQAKLGEQQAKLGEKQARLGEEQAKRAEEATRHLKALIDEAFQKGLVEPEPR
jgi:beta-lactamase regulating signal transducer with metallopeptidase domain